MLFCIRTTGNSRHSGEFGGAGAHLLGEKQFATGHGEYGRDLQLRDRSLVGDGEVAHLADLVTPELDPHRMVGGGTENIQDAAAHRELPTAGHHVHPGVCELDQTGDQPIEFRLGTDGELHRLQIEQLGGHRLQQRAHRGHHHPQRHPHPGILRMGQPMQYLQPGTHGVDTG